MTTLFHASTFLHVLGDMVRGSKHFALFVSATTMGGNTTDRAPYEYEESGSF